MPGARTRIWTALGATVLLAVAAGCAGDGSVDEVTQKVPMPKGIANCDDVYKDNAVVNPKTFGEACAQGDDMVVPRPVVLHCSNDKTLYTNEFAWGFENQKMTLIDPKAPAHDQFPYDSAIKCLGKSAAQSQSDLNKDLGSAGDSGN